MVWLFFFFVVAQMNSFFFKYIIFFLVQIVFRYENPPIIPYPLLSLRPGRAGHWVNLHWCIYNVGRWVVYISSILWVWLGRTEYYLSSSTESEGRDLERTWHWQQPSSCFYFFSCAILLSLASYGIDFAIECMSSVCTYVRSLRDESMYVCSSSKISHEWL